MRQLARFVYVTDDSGQTHGFGPGDTVPEWAAAQITNPRAWFEPAGEASPDTSPPGPPAVVPPPRAGAGSSTEAWKAFAAGKVDVTDDMGRDDIVAALEAAGHLTP